jgi:pimeloyl-ACP methyl ester carboxylesterase
MVPPKTRRVPLATGLTYQLLEWGPDDADHTVFLIHGFLDLSWGWAPMVEASGLADRVHIVAPDMRGHGDSDRVGAGGYYYFMDYVADLHELIGEVGRDRVSLVGHSMGGSVCGYYAGTFPDRVDRLALLEGTGPPETVRSGPDRVRLWLDGWRRARDKPAKVYADHEMAAQQLRKHDPRLSAEMADLLADKGTRPTEGGLTFKHDPLHLTMGPYPYRVDYAREFWQAITCPVLIVEGSESAFKYDDTERARRYGSFANATVEQLDGAAHMMQRHRPRELGQLLAEFLTV